MVGRWISFWDGLFSGAILVSGRVTDLINSLALCSMRKALRSVGWSWTTPGVRNTQAGYVQRQHHPEATSIFMFQLVSFAGEIQRICRGFETIHFGVDTGYLVTWAFVATSHEAQTTNLKQKMTCAKKGKSLLISVNDHQSYQYFTVRLWQIMLQGAPTTTST